MAAPQIPVVESTSLRPVCPHCEREIRQLCMRNLSGPLGRRYLYFCSECAKVLGVSHRKGFWMG